MVVNSWVLYVLGFSHQLHTQRLWLCGVSTQVNCCPFLHCLPTLVHVDWNGAAYVQALLVSASGGNELNSDACTLGIGGVVGAASNGP